MSALVTSEENHPALFETLEARMDYARVVGAIVAADEEVTADEVRGLRNLCRNLAIPPDHADTIVSESHDPNSEHVRELLFGLRESELRFTLLTDMVVLGHADGKYDVPERRQVRGLATLMLVGEDQVGAIEDAVAVRMGDASGDLFAGMEDDEPREARDWIADLAAPLAAVGVPASAVIALSPIGPSPAAAMTAGLTALGAGLGPVPGLGVAVGLGLGSFLGVRALYRFAVAAMDEDP